MRGVMVKTETDELVTMAEAARLRGVTHQAIADLVKRGRLRSMDIAGRPHVFKDEVLNYQPSKGGRPSKKTGKRKSAVKK
jgi:hypothetical protein